ncbi:MAG: hypothetical protein IH877_05905 [Gemmatimonadetes bacterium]|nr:hypothetical protein [Gemmatimonadota bacterium]
MSPDWVIAWALAVGAASAAGLLIIRLKTLIGRKDPDRSSNPQIDALVDDLRLEIDNLREDHDHQLTELQERLDFTERLLSKGRDE